MRNFLKTAAAAAVIALAGAWSASAEQVKVGFSPEAYPPFYQQDASGNWGGWEVEIINAICAEAKVECVLTPIPWDGLIPALTDQEDRRDHELDVDHRRAHEDDRLLRQVLQHADRRHRRQGPEVRRDARRTEGQDHRRAGIDHARGLRQEALHAKPPRSRNTRRRTRPTRIWPPVASTPPRPTRSRSTLS